MVSVSPGKKRGVDGLNIEQIGDGYNDYSGYLDVLEHWLPMTLATYI